MRWAKLIASIGGICIPFGLTADNAGHVYVAGTLPYILHIGSDTVVSGLADEYQATGLIQLDTNGNYKWIRYIGNNTFASEIATGSIADPIALDGANNIHYFCYVQATGLMFTPSVISTYGVYDMTYNTSGTLLSAVRLDLDSAWYLHAAVIDPATNKLYVCGEVNQGIYGGFITDSFYAAAFDPSRHLLWQYFSGHGDDDGLTGVVLDQSKHLHFSGAAQSPTMDTTRFSFNGDSVSNTHYPFYEMSVILTTDTNGHPEWIKSFDGNLAINMLNSIALLPNNKVAAFGQFAGTITDGVVSLGTPAGDGWSPFIIVVDSAGDLQTAQPIRGDGFYNEGFAVATDQVGNIYVGGQVADSIWAGTPPIPAYHTIGGNTDFFVMKYGVDCSCTSSPIAAYTDTGTSTIGVTYTGTTSGLDSIVWNFGDGTTTTGPSAIHSYSLAGTYHVCVTVYTTCGSDIHCSDITVACSGSSVVASFSDTGSHTIGVTYTGSTAGVDSIVWHYGDGHTGSGMTALHTYSVSGTYTVCVYVYTSCGVDSSCSSVVIHIPSETATITGSPGITVYPNPANEELNIMGILQSTAYRLVSVTGLAVQEGVLQTGSNFVSLRNIAPGIYILEMSDRSGERTIVRVVKE